MGTYQGALFPVKTVYDDIMPIEPDRLLKDNFWKKMKDLKSLYETDYALWLDRTIADLKDRKLDSIDWENLIEEVEDLSRRERHELRSRLITLFEHLLKRCYVNYPNNYGGWEETIFRTQRDIQNLLEDSPSLKNYFQLILIKCYQDARTILTKNRDYIGFSFPKDNCFPTDPDRLLNDIFWE